MRYWDAVDAATLSGRARAEQEIFEAESGSLARFLPSAYVDDIAVEFEPGANGLVAEALYRAYDAEPEFADSEPEASVMIKLPAVSQKSVISEYAQLRLRGTDGAIEAAINKHMRRAVRAVGNTAERQRANVLVTGKAVSTQRNFKMSDDFGRDPALTATAATLWTLPATNRLDSLKAFSDVYATKAGADAGAIVMDRDAWAAFVAGNQFQVALANGASRPSSEDEVRSFAVAAGLPPIEVNKRRTSRGPVLPSGTVLFLPAPVDPTDVEGAELGATFWGSPLSSLQDEYEIPDEERPGIIAIAEKNDSVPHIAQVTADSIQLPVLANANLSGALKVL